MSAAVVFILFVICLVIAIPVSISLGIVAVVTGGVGLTSSDWAFFSLFSQPVPAMLSALCSVV